MQSLKRSYMLPRETVEQFEQSVPAGKRSAVIAELLNECVAERRCLQFRTEVIEGCREMAKTYLEIAQEYHPLEEDTQRTFDAD